MRKIFPTIAKHAVLLLLATALVAFCAMCLCACGSQEEDNQDLAISVEEFAGKRIGYLTSTSCAELAQNIAGDSGTAMGFNGSADLGAALEAGKIDLYVLDGPAALCLMHDYEDQYQVDDYLMDIDYGAIFSNSNADANKLREQLNEWIARAKADGTLESIHKLWTECDEADQVVDRSGLTGVNGTIKVATDSALGKPYCYLKNGEFVGFDIDVITRFCTDYGYGLEWEDSDFAGMLAAVSTGKCPFAVGAMAITPERLLAYDMSDSYYDSGAMAVAKDSSYSTGQGFWRGTWSSTYRTFVDENRWELLLSGVFRTMLITLVSIVFGTLLGYAVYLLCRKGGKIANGIVNFCMWLVGGMPTVVLLMVLFYIVFAAVNINSTLVAIIAFVLVFASSTVGMIRTGVNAVDPGQAEAARAMGYSDTKAFNKIILPQAIRHILPTYQAEAIGLLKATAVVGYISVRDLTKMGDIIRSATYEAFIPLIAVAVVYFVLEALLKVVLKLLAKRLDPENRSASKILKGCK